MCVCVCVAISLVDSMNIKLAMVAKLAQHFAILLIKSMQCTVLTMYNITLTSIS